MLLLPSVCVCFLYNVPEFVLVAHFNQYDRIIFNFSYSSGIIVWRKLNASSQMLTSQMMITPYMTNICQCHPSLAEFIWSLTSDDLKIMYFVLSSIVGYLPVQEQCNALNHFGSIFILNLFL